MAQATTERSGSLVEAHKGYDPRTIFFYFVIAGLLLALIGGLAYQQLIKTNSYHELERQQNQRRILIPGPRGNIYDREGRLLVGNRARFSVTLHLDELRKKFREEFIRVRKNYRELGDKDDSPNASQMGRIARYSVVQGYLDQVNTILGRSDKLDAKDLDRHFHGELLLPFTLVDDLKPEEYAKLAEQLDVKSPLQLVASSVRYYPYGSAAAHVLGYVRNDDNLEAEEAFSRSDLATFNDKNTFKIRGTSGDNGIELEYDSLLQGETGGVVYRVDPSGYRVDPPVLRRIPSPGKNLTTSLDVDLQRAAEEALERNRTEDDSTPLKSAAVVLDINTGEVLTMASKPDYDLNDFSPRRKPETIRRMDETEAWTNRALNGLYPPGSTFKILTSVAGLHANVIVPNQTVNCTGHYLVGSRSFPCHAGHAHGEIALRDAIAKSCNIYFYAKGIDAGVDAISKEARRFHLDRPTDIELPHETHGMIVPSEAWKEKTSGEKWFPGDTANMAIGQGFLQVTPLQMATFVSSVARGEVFTQPTLEHQTSRGPQHTEPIGLTPAQTAALREGMEECIRTGTGKLLKLNFKHNIRVAGKTGTAQKRTSKGTINFAWFICYAPVEKPEIAVAIVVEGDKPDDEYGGGTYAAPVAGAILQKYFDKKTGATLPTAKPAAAAPPSPLTQAVR
ncbi:MAG: penicillin-binding transpeptidase domain-containing protein [Nibricoccus sp.]